MSDCQLVQLSRGLSVRCHCLLRGSLVICLIFFSVMSTYAGEQLSFDQQIERLKTAKKVSVILGQTPESIIGYTKDRARNLLLRLDSCHYVVTSQPEIKNLIANFTQLNIKRISQAESFLPYESIAIRFDFANGQQMQMLIGFPYPNESTVDGEMYIHTQLAPHTFVMNRMIHRDIRRWLANNGQVVEPTSCGHSRYCGALASYCRSEIRVDYYRSKPNQTCKVSDFDRPVPDYCERGWEPSYNVKEIN